MSAIRQGTADAKNLRADYLCDGCRRWRTKVMKRLLRCRRAKNRSQQRSSKRRKLGASIPSTPPISTAKPDGKTNGAASRLTPRKYLPSRKRVRTTHTRKTKGASVKYYGCRHRALRVYGFIPLLGARRTWRGLGCVRSRCAQNVPC